MGVAEAVRAYGFCRQSPLTSQASLDITRISTARGVSSGLHHLTIPSFAAMKEAFLRVGIVSMSWVSLIGLVAAFCTTAAYVPQVLHIWRTRSTQDISLGMFSVMTLGVALWIVYGVAIVSLPVIIANGATLILAGAILVLKLKHG